MNRDDRTVDIKGTQLSDKSIDFVVTGGIAAIESPKAIRELRRYGANIRVFMTPRAAQFVSPLVFEWASNNPVITDLSGAAEHITHADAIVVAPATLDFIAKIANGFADSAAATLVQSALSRIPLFFSPSMHLSLASNPLFLKNIGTLREIEKVYIFDSQNSEGKAKMIDFESMTAQVCRFMSATSLRDVPVVISLGPTRSYGDDMRFLSNRSTGALGLAIADEIYRSGGEVYTVAGPTQVEIPYYLNPQFVETNEEMRLAFESVVAKKNPRIGIFSAAVLDFEIANSATGKFSSKESWEWKLKPSPKLIQSKSWPASMTRVGFKLESRLTVEELKTRARRWAEENQCELLVANRLEDVSENHTAYLYSRKLDSFTEVSGKREIARRLTESLLAQ